VGNNPVIKIAAPFGWSGTSLGPQEGKGGSELLRFPPCTRKPTGRPVPKGGETLRFAREFISF